MEREREREGREITGSLVRVRRTQLAVHLNMITKHKAVSKAVRGKLVRGN